MTASASGWAKARHTSRLMSARPRSLRYTALRFYRLTHERLLKSAEELTTEQFAWSAGPSLHSVAWQLWHSARWDDVFAAHFHMDFGRDPQTQVWERESMAERWHLVSGSLGRRDAGTELSDELNEKIRFPVQKDVIAYARLAFAYAEAAVELMPEQLLLDVAAGDKDGDTNLDNVLIYLEHLSRHLGMIESIRGLQGLVGSSTR
jgi:hypothetical protein